MTIETHREDPGRREHDAVQACPISGGYSRKHEESGESTSEESRAGQVPPCQVRIGLLKIEAGSYRAFLARSLLCAVSTHISGPVDAMYTLKLRERSQQPDPSHCCESRTQTQERRSEI